MGGVNYLVRPAKIIVADHGRGHSTEQADRRTFWKREDRNLRREAVRRDVAREVQRETISEHGQLTPESSTIPSVKAVALEQWRWRWALRTGHEDSSGNNIKVNLNKDKDPRLKTGKVSVSEPYVWLMDDRS